MLTNDPAAVLVGGRYEIVRTIGRGSFGHTLQARDRVADRPVALKLLTGVAASNWKARELFGREAAVLGALRHHGVPMVYETVEAEWEGRPALFLVMEYIEGTSLAQVIASNQSLDEIAVISSFLDLLGILEYLHSRVPPILHRDIKPANIIMRTDGAPALVDFGSVRSILFSPEESGSTIAGTYGYMPYEQYMGQASPTSDLYALAATYLHVLTGRSPREFMNDDGHIAVPLNLSAARLAPILTRMLKPSPAERFSSAQLVRQALLAPVSTQLVAGSGTAVARSPVELPPAPRLIEGSTADLLDRVSPSGWNLMDTANKPGQKGGLVDIAIFVFLSAATLGVLPMVFFGMARSQRNRMRRFLQLGVPASAQILKVELEDTSFGEKLARVTYEFTVDGRHQRDSDRVLPLLAAKWVPGDSIDILFIAEDDYDSAIISTS